MCDYNIIWVLKGELIITELTVAMIYVYIISWGDTGLVVNCLMGPWDTGVITKVLSPSRLITLSSQSEESIVPT